MNIKLISESYEITEKGTLPGRKINISAVVKDGRITLIDSYGRDGFVFKGSKPEMLVLIGGLIAGIGKKLK